MTARERGAGAVEYLGVVLAVVVIVAGLSLTTAGGQIAGYIEQGICRVGSMVNGGACAEGAPEAGEEGPNFEPESCTVATSSSTHEGGVSIAIVDLGADHGVKIAEVRHADGTVEYVVTADTGVEAGVGWGPGFEAAEAKASAELGISGNYSQGPTYTVGTLEEAQALRDQMIVNPWANVGQDPTSETVTWGGEVSVSVDLGIAFPTVPFLEPPGSNGMAGSQAEISGAHDYSTTTYADGSTVYSTSWSGSISAGAGVVDAVNASGSWTGSTNVSIKRDANGQVVEISFETATQGGSDLKVGDDGLNVTGGPDTGVVTSTTLQVNDSNRHVVEQWMSGQVGGDNYLGLAPLGTIFWDPTSPSTDPMQNLLFNEAQVSQVTMQTTESSWSTGGEWKVWGLKLGAKYTYTDENGIVVAAEYAGAPEAGRRPWLHMEVCFP